MLSDRRCLKPSDRGMLWKVLSKKILQMKSKINNRLMIYLTSDIVNL